MKASVKQTNQRNDNDSESFLSDLSKDADIEAKPKQMKRKQKERKIKG